MKYHNLLSKSGVKASLARIHALSPTSSPLWGKMNVSQMLAHVNVAYEMDHDNIHPRPGLVTRLLLRTFIKKAVCGPKPYPKNGRTAPQFVISDSRDFELEKNRLIDYMSVTAAIGPQGYEGRQNSSFGPLTAEEWNVLYSKHLDHHLRQFGV